MEVRAGDTIGHYRVLEKVGEGGMGAVWKAEDVHLQRTVALKFLHAADDVPRLLREAQAAASLTHPNVAGVHEVDPERGFLAMEFVEGRTLKQIIGGRPMPVKDALRIARQAGEGLKAAHEKKITHRDVKPANIMVTGSGLVKIMDFGLARMSDQAGLTVDGAAAGTPGYMAPEQLRGEPVDRRTDIWAFGAVLHEMLTGRPPAGQTDTLPEGLGRAVRKALAADPDERYQHIEDLLVDLRRADSAAPAMSRRAWLWTAGSAAAASAAAIAVWLSQREQDTGIRSIAVLPLQNLSNDPEQDYFVDGLHEEITALLSKISGLRVISRTSTLLYRKNPKPATEIGRELNVEGLLEGSVRRVANEVAITLQLIRAATDEHLWAETYRRPMVDVLALQADTARAAVEAIGVTLKPAERRALTAARQVSPAAYEAYLRGRQALLSRSIPEAKRWFEQAIQADSSFALAYIGMADSHMAVAFSEARPADNLLKAEEYGARAVALSPTPQARYAMVNPRGWRTYDWRASYRVAMDWIADDSNNAHAHYVVASYCIFTFLKRQEDAIRHMTQALALDPFSYLYDEQFGRILFLARQYDKAVARYRALPGRHAGTPQARSTATRFLAFTYALLGDAVQARRALDDLAPISEPSLAPALVRVGRETEAKRIVESAVKNGAAGASSPYGIALGYLALGDATQAFDWLNAALDQLDAGTLYLLAHPWWDPVRSDPRYQAAVRRRFGEVTER